MKGSETSKRQKGKRVVSLAPATETGKKNALRPLGDEPKHRHQAHQARVLQLATQLVLERVGRDERVVHLRDHLAIDDVEKLADGLRTASSAVTLANSETMRI